MNRAELALDVAAAEHAHAVDETHHEAQHGTRSQYRAAGARQHAALAELARAAQAFQAALPDLDHLDTEAAHG